MFERQQNRTLKPVYSTTLHSHGLLGVPFVRRHMFMDERWTTSSLTEQVKGMGEMLGKYQVFKKLENNKNRESFLREKRQLMRECREARQMLQMLQNGKSIKY